MIASYHSVTFNGQRLYDGGDNVISHVKLENYVIKR